MMSREAGRGGRVLDLSIPIRLTPMGFHPFPRSGGAARGASEGREGKGVAVEVPKHRQRRWAKPAFAYATPWKPWEGLALPSAPASPPCLPRASRGLAKPSAPTRRSIGINRRSTEKSGPFSSVCRGEGWDEESARNGAPVGTALEGRPPDRSRRADFPHRAPTLGQRVAKRASGQG
jgi:hypothetical protein